MMQHLVRVLMLISLSCTAYAANAAPCKGAPIPKHLSTLSDEQRVLSLTNAGWTRLEMMSDEASKFYEFNNRMPSWCTMVSQCWEIYKDPKGRVLQLYRPDGVLSAHLFCGAKRVKISIR